MNESIEILADKGYQGITKIHNSSYTPKKKPKNKSLTSQEKEYNRELAKRRIYVEHVIRCLKIFRILAQQYRNRRRDIYDFSPLQLNCVKKYSMTIPRECQYIQKNNLFRHKLGGLSRRNNGLYSKPTLQNLGITNDELTVVSLEGNTRNIRIPYSR